MKGFEVLGYPVWNDVKHNSSREDDYIRWSFCSFKDGVIDCNGSEEYMVFQTNNDVYIDLFPMPDFFVEKRILDMSPNKGEDQGVHNGYCQKVYERKIGEAVIELLHHEYLANKE